MNHLRENGMCANETCAMPAPQESLTERMLNAAEIGRKVNDMTRRIRGSLFGYDSAEGEAKEKAPECMEGLLERHRSELLNTARVLDEICARLGV